MIVLTLFSLVILGIFLLILFWVLRKEIPGLIFLGFIIGVFISAMLVDISMTSKPTAMDVYQNKTELEYIIRGGEMVDSVVVFKNK